MGLRLMVVILCVLSPLYGEAPPTTPERPPAKSGTPEPPHGDKPANVFVNTKPLDIPIIRDGKLMGYIGLTATIEAVDEATAKELSEMGSQIRDRMLRDLWAAYYILWKPEFLPDEDILKRQIEKSVNTLVGSDKIKAIYIKDFYFKPGPSYQHTAYG